MAVALAPHGISVTTVAPGFVDTERQQAKLSSADGDAARAQSSFGRVGTVEEIAAAIDYLTSPDAQWTAGVILYQTARPTFAPDPRPSRCFAQLLHRRAGDTGPGGVVPTRIITARTCSSASRNRARRPTTR